MINYPDGRKYTSAQTPTEKPKKSKYGAVKTEVDGIMFDSKREASRYQELRLLEQAGEIANLRLQVPYILFPKNEHGRALKYIADFVYNDDTGALVVEDAKGHSTDVYKIKRRLMAELKGIEIKET
ncbi:DUF1064 domain-containing protein [[Clostridium] innocuum]|uniref:DUF1064 domain-containing protein n=2 Tax=Clostridium innocuum TaxID=1522 RepID=A0AAP9MIK5_CLOIN|nr:DUF1064 domain-containing protein [[Clostridium] innocuum]MBS9792306.1 DUF1064 domain-containing protein [[Clostridium] innocuum]MBU9113107.1 DUF1064 domain-containing protein [[Clostridium] innocuum]MDU2955336.1 DUF1064 domain-containing protein [[Clostridium] innocuum]QJA04497.1 DUF1064 domain-containing protein [[Clostridium] innocuum]